MSEEGKVAAVSHQPSDVPGTLEHVRAIAPYQAGKPIGELAREFGLDPATIVKLASNENPLGVPESARKAMAAAVEDLGRYPDSNGFELKAALAVRYDVPTDWITLGNGSNDILELAASATLTAGRSCIYAQHSFAVYALATQARGARAIVVPARQLGHDLDAMLAAIAPDTALIYIANPNNPTGTHLPAPAIDAFLSRVPPRVVVVLDEAYNEYLPPELRVDSTAWVRRHRNVIVSRTFSKAFGLAGLRVGYGLAQRELTDLLNRVRQPFNVSTVAQAAAVAALADEDFLARSYALNLRGMQQLTEAFRALGLEYVPSVGNFVLVKVGAAATVYHELLKRGVIVRPVANYGLPEWLRVTVGLPEENAAFLKALPQALAAARG
jgi:histidinol-phosphate aminotransferase